MPRMEIDDLSQTDSPKDELSKAQALSKSLLQ
jgi:hypothetical protein